MRLLFLLLFSLTSILVNAQSTTVVISQVYGGGGSGTATYGSDYVELHNISGTDQDISGYKVFYGSASGNLSSSFTLPSSGVVIPAGGYYLLATAASVNPLPVTADQTFSLNMSATSGKIAFGTSAMTSGTTLALQPAGSVIDFVGYGTANEFETAACPALNATSAAIRNNNGCDDTNNNSSDFTVGVPNPHNSSSPVVSCTSSPLLTASPAVPNMYTTSGVASAAQTFNVSGSNLSGFPGNITINAPVGFEISFSTSFTGLTSLSLPFTTATLGSTPVYIRIQSSTVLGGLSGIVSISGGGAATVNLPITGNVLSAEPTVQASNIVFSNITDNTVDVNWTNGNGSNRIVVIHLTSVSGVPPTDGASYSANTNIFSAATTGTGNYVVYNGTGSGPLTITNLTAGTNYTVNVYEYNSAATGAENYLTSSNTNNPNSANTTGISPVLQRINFTSVSTPQFMGSGTSSRIPTMFFAKLSNLQPNTTYRYYTQAALASDLGTTGGGAGNSILTDYTVTPATLTYSSSLSVATANGYGKFTTDAGGNFKGSFGFVHTSNSRFTPGNFVSPTITLTQEGNTFVQYRFALNDSIKVLQFAITSGANDGSFINGTSLSVSGNIIGLWSSVNGGFTGTAVTEKPISMTLAEKPTVATGNGGSAWRTSFISGYDSTVGSWNTIIPNLNNEGVRLIQQIDAVSAEVLGCNSDEDGIWPFGTITTNPVNGSTAPLQIVSADAPLNGGTCYRILPVKIGSFEVAKNGSTVKLNWATLQEIDLKEFVIEKSTDGLHWKIMNVLNAFGNSTTERRYTTVDYMPSSGLNYYRLKSVAISGMFEYSSIKSVKFNGDIRLAVMPNPATAFAVINIDSKFTGEKSIQMLDAKGFAVRTFKSNANRIKINISDLQKGIYYIRVFADGEVFADKMMIL